MRFSYFYYSLLTLIIWQPHLVFCSDVFFLSWNPYKMRCQVSTSHKGCYFYILNQSQNKKGLKFVSAAPKMVSVSQLPAETNFRPFLFLQSFRRRLTPSLAPRPLWSACKCLCRCEYTCPNPRIKAFKIVTM